ncbi:hypothetical protein BGZ63DRAFT_263889 [Mariannaea sp. PMI_226]|nr:hypothetical protein BGZ63DRAFT_263889 [Mariannaea sp. PMI_226]
MLNTVGPTQTSPTMNDWHHLFCSATLCADCIESFILLCYTLCSIRFCCFFSSVFWSLCLLVGSCTPTGTRYPFPKIPWVTIYPSDRSAAASCRRTRPNSAANRTKQPEFYYRSTVSEYSEEQKSWVCILRIRSHISIELTWYLYLLPHSLISSYHCESSWVNHDNQAINHSGRNNSNRTRPTPQCSTVVIDANGGREMRE